MNDFPRWLRTLAENPNSSTIRLDLVQVEDGQAERHAKKHKAEDIKDYDTGKDQLTTDYTIW